jgi:bifunctional ADP-heptose synthase (sugar kinase/adenylyltransferase)
MITPVGQGSTTAAATIKTGPGSLVSVVLCGGADAATCTVYDSTSASGTVIAKLGVAAATSDSFCPSHPIAVGTGIHVALTGTTPQINIAYI